MRPLSPRVHGAEMHLRILHYRSSDRPAILSKGMRKATAHIRDADGDGELTLIGVHWNTTYRHVSAHGQTNNTFDHDIRASGS